MPYGDLKISHIQFLPEPYNLKETQLNQLWDRLWYKVINKSEYTAEGQLTLVIKKGVQEEETDSWGLKHK